MLGLTVLLASDESAICATGSCEKSQSSNRHDTAASWAQKALAAKNTLTAGDLRLLQDAFEQRLSEFFSAEPLRADENSTRIAQ